jgi:hypothetical protein
MQNMSAHPHQNFSSSAQQRTSADSRERRRGVQSYQQNLFKNLCISARQNPQAVDAIAISTAMPKLSRLRIVARP